MYYGILALPKTYEMSLASTATSTQQQELQSLALLHVLTTF